jgi:uncharacterized protein
VNPVRHALHVSGAPARALLLGMIVVYRSVLSGWLGGQCRFHPTCSRYAETAIRTHGAIRGTALATWRVLRCNPFGSGGIDPAPEARRVGDAVYDTVSRRRTDAGTDAGAVASTGGPS